MVAAILCLISVIIFLVSGDVDEEIISALHEDIISTSTTTKLLGIAGNQQYRPSETRRLVRIWSEWPREEGCGSVKRGWWRLSPGTQWMEAAIGAVMEVDARASEGTPDDPDGGEGMLLFEED